MNWDATAAIAELLGSVAVFATLAYLAIQIRQANRTSNFDSTQANRDMRMEWMIASRDSPYIPEIMVKIRNEEPLTPQEEIRWNLHLNSLWGLLYSSWVQIDQGFGGQYVQLNLGGFREMMIEHWEEIRGNYPEEFRNFVSDEILPVEGRV